MNMRRNTPSDNMLILVDNGMISSAVLSDTLSLVGYMLQNDGLSSFFLDFGKLALEPGEHVSWVAEPNEAIPVHGVANV